jgi:dihydrofolate reductase
MRRLRYCVAASLDGFIAGPKGEYDWITPDPSFDFSALWEQFDTLLMGRLTYEVASTRLAFLHSMGKKIVVVSTTLDAARDSKITILRDNIHENVANMKAGSGKDIWLMGGGALFRGLVDAGLVDGVQVTVMPVLLGGGVPLIPVGKRHSLQLTESQVMPNGSVVLHYAINSQPASS